MKKKIAVGLTAGLLLLGNISVAQATTLSGSSLFQVGKPKFSFPPIR